MNTLRPTLSAVLAFVDGHVKFAETKNAAILAANAATLIGVGQILSSSGDLSRWTSLYLALVALFSCLAAITALLSFLPRTRIPWLHQDGDYESGDNLWFFGHIQKYRVHDYLSGICKAEGLPADSWSSADRMLAEQVVINSRIAATKFTYAGYAMWLTLHGVLTPLLATLLYGVMKDRRSSDAADL